MSNNKVIQDTNFTADIEAINRIPIISQLLDVVCRTTKMRFASIARVTEDRWITCYSKDEISFGLKPGDELPVETTLCHEVSQSKQAISIDHVEKDPVFYCHPTPSLYGFQSYISVPIIKKDGSFFGTLCALDTSPAQIDTPEIKGMFTLFADLISFHLGSIEEMDSMTAKLEAEKQQAEAREQFISILGHDLRNPIATAKMSAEILQKFSKEELAIKQAKTIKSTVFRMEGLVDNMLDFARGRFGEGIILDLEKDNNALEDIILQVINEVQTISPEVKLDVNLDFDSEVDCDPNRIGQLLANLLNNAITHGSADEPVTVKATCNKEQFEISVANSGEKIPEAALKHLFKPFYREEVRPGKQGLGLGLFITSEIARAHGGRMDVDSNDERTLFTFSMPLSKN